MSDLDQYWPLLIILRVAWAIGLAVLIGIGWGLERLHVPGFVFMVIGAGYLGLGGWLFRPMRSTRPGSGRQNHPPAA